MRLLFVLRIGLGLALGIAGAGQIALAAAAPPNNFQSLHKLLKTPEAQIDLAKAKLAVDQLIDPSIDVSGTLRQLDAMADKIGARFPQGATQKTKVEYLVVALSQPGVINDNHAFSYDLNDPLGKNIKNKLLPTYLATRKGNCVSMPILLVILGQKLGINITLATAPKHLFAKYRNESGQWIGIEATAFGYGTDEWYRRELVISDKAMTNRIYLRPLTKRESVGVMMGTLMEFYGEKGQQKRRIEVADMALQIDPKDVSAMLQKGNSYVGLIRQQYIAKYRTPQDIPPDQRQEYVSLNEGFDRVYSQAEALGWTRPTPEQDAAYLQSIKSARAAQKRGQ